MAENVRKENVQNALKDLQKYLDDLYYSDEERGGIRVPAECIGKPCYQRRCELN